MVFHFTRNPGYYLKKIHWWSYSEKSVTKTSRDSTSILITFRLRSIKEQKILRKLLVKKYNRGVYVTGN